MFQQVLAYIILLAGLIYAAVIIKIIYAGKDQLGKVPGDLRQLSIFEFIIFLLSSFGITDYTMQTILGKKLRIITDEELPGTVVGCSLVPGAILGFFLLRTGDYVEIKTLLACGIPVAIGSILGSNLAGRLDGKTIKSIMRIALILSLVFLIIRMIISRGVTGNASGLTGTKLIVVAVLCFFTGLINMFGIPMKPTRTAIFLIAGLSPLTTLTLVLVLGALSPLAGGIEVLRRDNYQRKMVLASVVFGSIGAVLGIAFAISIPAAILNIVLIAVMVFAIVIMFRD